MSLSLKTLETLVLPHNMEKILKVFGVLYLCAQASNAEKPTLHLKFGETKADFQILIGEVPWFSQNASSSSSYVCVTSNGKTLSNRDGTLTIESIGAFNGIDVLGSFNSTLVFWKSPEVQQSLGFATKVQQYDDGQTLVFSQMFQVIGSLVHCISKFIFRKIDFVV